MQAVDSRVLPSPTIHGRPCRVGESAKQGHHKPDITLAMAGESWSRLYLSQDMLEDLIKNGDIKVQGDAAEAARLFNLFDRYRPEKAVVMPSAFVEHAPDLLCFAAIRSKQGE